MKSDRFVCICFGFIKRNILGVRQLEMKSDKFVRLCSIMVASFAWAPPKRGQPLSVENVKKKNKLDVCDFISFFIRYPKRNNRLSPPVQFRYVREKLIIT